MRRSRSSSDVGPRREPTVLLRMANNSQDRGAPVSRLVSASDVRGFTQQHRRQLPTIYFRTRGGTGDGRATQEHGHVENIGAHPQRARETFFGNIIHPRDPRRVVLFERFADGARHRSRAAFHDLTRSPEGREAAIHSLQRGPLNFRDLSLQARGSRDDW